MYMYTDIQHKANGMTSGQICKMTIIEWTYIMIYLFDVPTESSIDSLFMSTVVRLRKEKFQ